MLTFSVWSFFSLQLHALGIIDSPALDFDSDCVRLIFYLCNLIFMKSIISWECVDDCLYFRVHRLLRLVVEPVIFRYGAFGRTM